MNWTRRSFFTIFTIACQYEKLCFGGEKCDCLIFDNFFLLVLVQK